MKTDRQFLSTKVKIGFGICDLGGNLFFTIMGFYLLFFLTDIVKLAAGLECMAGYVGSSADYYVITDFQKIGIVKHPGIEAYILSHFAANNHKEETGENGHGNDRQDQPDSQCINSRIDEPSDSGCRNRRIAADFDTHGEKPDNNVIPERDQLPGE